MFFSEGSPVTTITTRDRKQLSENSVRLRIKMSRCEIVKCWPAWW